MKKKTLAIIACVLVVAGLFVSCNKGKEQSSDAGADTRSAEDALARIKAAGVIKVGTEGTYAPYSFHDETGALVGFDVEVAQLVAEELGVKAEFIETKWDSMIAGLDAGRFDVIVNQVGITPERQEKYLFSTPYTYIYGALISHKDNQTVTSLQDIAGLKSAQSLTSNWAQSAENFGAELVGVDGFDQAVELIANGRADVTINSEASYYDYLTQKPDAPIKLVSQLEDLSIVGIPVRKGEESLHQAIDAAITSLQASGALSEVSIKYFGKDLTTE